MRGIDVSESDEGHRGCFTHQSWCPPLWPGGRRLPVWGAWALHPSTPLIFIWSWQGDVGNCPHSSGQRPSSHSTWATRQHLEVMASVNSVLAWIQISDLGVKGSEFYYEVPCAVQGLKIILYYTSWQKLRSCSCSSLSFVFWNLNPSLDQTEYGYDTWKNGKDNFICLMQSVLKVST